MAKYIIFDGGRRAIVFPSILNHSDIGKELWGITSAGECEIHEKEGVLITRLGSYTLGIEAKQCDPNKDREAIKASLYYKED